MDYALLGEGPAHAGEPPQRPAGGCRAGPDLDPDAIARELGHMNWRDLGVGELRKDDVGRTVTVAG